MPDRLTLSCWLRGFHPLSMQSHWEKLLTLFPYSRLAEGLTVVRVHAVSLSEPILLEQGYQPPFDPADAAQVARDFQHDDSAFQVECYWDLMVEDEGDWRLRPAPVSLWCFAPAFDNETTDHIRIEFGLEDMFLPQPDDEASIRASQANLRSLTRLVHEIGATLPVERQHLWSESGTNFAQTLEAVVSGRGPGLALQ